MRACRGFTLVELMVTATIVAILVIAAAPLASNWAWGSMTHTARTQLVEASNVTTALALQNPTAAALPAAAAGMRITTDGTTTTVYVCTGSSSAATCSSGGSSVQWSVTYSGSVTTSLNGVAATQAAPLTWDVDDRGEPLSGVVPFLLTLNGAGNNESGYLY
jgi:prepilin-type N-terminal cleavage/methylation domain-containing protein